METHTHTRTHARTHLHFWNSTYMQLRNNIGAIGPCCSWALQLACQCVCRRWTTDQTSLVNQRQHIWRGMVSISKGIQSSKREGRGLINFSHRQKIKQKKWLEKWLQHPVFASCNSPPVLFLKTMKPPFKDRSARRSTSSQTKGLNLPTDSNSYIMWGVKWKVQVSSYCSWYSVTAVSDYTQLQAM